MATDNVNCLGVPAYRIQALPLVGGAEVRWIPDLCMYACAYAHIGLFDFNDFDISLSWNACCALEN